MHPARPRGLPVNPEDWSESVAKELAGDEGITLTDEHWPVLHFMQRYWTSQRVAPDVRHVVEFLVENGAADKKAAKAALFRLFPYGYVKQACKIAGMQRPRAWSTG
ncbi:MAG: TusE/DsrC/DsvC family sulfur relay protein [Gammaproteobacteria bacterium]|nr:TusE/DsrC/DsvC family sulfur relay protein [Gammaproteobacteria bacterium]